MTKDEAIRILEEKLNYIVTLRNSQYVSQEQELWHKSIIAAIKRIFTKDGESRASEFDSLCHPIIIAKLNPANNVRKDAYKNYLQSAETELKAMVQEINEWGIGEESSSIKAKTNIKVPINIKKVFIVHGRDNSPKESVARFIEKLDLEPVILHERPNEGRTIIEKFEKHSDVEFAVVIMTPDDLGSLAENKDKLKPRARQNVILELGFFLGKLGRHKVCALYSKDIEMPSDYNGVLFIPLDSSANWKIALAKEIKASGIDIDMNKAFI